MKEIKKYSFGLYSILFIVNIFLMFFLTRHTGGGFAGHIIPWIIAVGMMPISLIMLMPPKKITSLNLNKTIFFGTLVVLNIAMGLFSILDIAGHAHYGVSSIMFVAVPIATILQHGFRHLNR